MKRTTSSLLFLSCFYLILSAQFLIDETTSLKTPTGNLEGTILFPNTNEKVPVVLIISGSGATDRNGNSASTKNNSLKLLAEGLKINNIASLRFDKRGVAKSASAAYHESELRFEHYVEDVVAWIEILKEDQRFSSIIIAGHSEGALIGMIATQRTNVSKYISLSGAGYPAADIIRKQLKGQPKTILDQALPILEQLEVGKTVENVPSILNSLFRKSVQPYMISWFSYNPQEEIKKLTCPILLIQGTTDIQVSMDNAEALSKANPKAQQASIDGMNHILKEAPSDRTKNIATYNQPTLELHAELLAPIINFIARQ